MKSISLHLFVFFFVLGTSSFAQQTIFELWDLPEGGCSLENPQPESEDNQRMFEEADVFSLPRPTLPEGYNSVEELIAKLGERVAQMYEEDGTFLRPKIRWSDGYDFFQEEQLSLLVVDYNQKV